MRGCQREEETVRNKQRGEIDKVIDGDDCVEMVGRQEEKYCAAAAMDCLLVFGEGHFALGATAGFNSSQTPWGALRHSCGSVSVITLH